MTAASPIHILIIEDNTDQAIAFVAILAGRTEVRWTSEIVSTLAAAIERLHGSGIDGVLLDLSLSDAHGLEAIKRAAEANHEVAIVVLTGWGGPEIEAQVKAAGADDFLIKPASPIDISVKLHQAIIHRKADRERKEHHEAMTEASGIIKQMMTNLDDKTRELAIGQIKGQ